MNFPASAESILRGDCSVMTSWGSLFLEFPWPTEDDDDGSDDDAVWAPEASHPRGRGKAVSTKTSEGVKGFRPGLFWRQTGLNYGCYHPDQRPGTISIDPIYLLLPVLYFSTCHDAVTLWQRKSISAYKVRMLNYLEDRLIRSLREQDNNKASLKLPNDRDHQDTSNTIYRQLHENLQRTCYFPTTLIKNNSLGANSDFLHNKHNTKMSTLPWGSPWAHCARAASVHLCSACVCRRHFQSSCRKLLSVHPWHPRVGSASWWKDRNNHGFLKQHVCIKVMHPIHFKTDKRRGWFVGKMVF